MIRYPHPFLQSRHVGRLTVALLAIGVGMPTAVFAQIGKAGVRRLAPTTWAITGARIVTPTTRGQVVYDTGTVVIRGGIIQAAGSAGRVKVPADARVIDGEGLTVYPGFIDAATTLGIPGQGGSQGGARDDDLPAAAPAAPGGAASGPASAPNSLQPAGLQPELRALDLVRLDAGTRRAFDNTRGAGITTALVAPQGGIFMGQSVLLDLGAASNPQRLVLNSPVALHAGFTPLRGGRYPMSLLGVFATLRQTLLDAQHYALVQAAHERNPRGVARPPTNASLEALQPALDRKMPVVMLANSQREIERALDLANEFNLRAIIAGGEEAWKVAPRLRSQGVPVIATLDFPRRTEAPSPDADTEPLRVLRERVDAPRNPARLAESDVEFAFTSSGLPSMNAFLPNMRQAVSDGLAKDRALRALTLDAADMLGIADRTGSIEAGKIANLTVVRGDLFEPDAHIVQVFVDGVPIEVRTPPAGRSRRPVVEGR